jgi:hypothetical protein
MAKPDRELRGRQSFNALGALTGLNLPAITLERKGDSHEQHEKGDRQPRRR